MPIMQVFKLNDDYKYLHAVPGSHYDELGSTEIASYLLLTEGYFVGGSKPVDLCVVLYQ